ncbi:hypothetical protein EG68_00948 [Paragonimus skrjabini miyazakii]|uniref:Uncharacterized protein n=1 Tax=Paragonimus skrjabini miyazakii TaxID=59628 RepID=A0A8S9Z304_9TREM|nr:hypothetical protein EG68_00948 [Paragonimus skrjabini miyazakii]
MSVASDTALSLSNVFSKRLMLYNVLRSLLNPNGPCLGAALLLQNQHPAFLLGTMSHMHAFANNLYPEVLKLVSESHTKYREVVLRDSVLLLPLPTQWSTRETENAGKNMESVPTKHENRRFKPLFYTDTGLYLTSMPPSDSPDEFCPGDGLVIRLVTLGILIVHVAANFPPTVSVNAVERLVESGAL